MTEQTFTSLGLNEALLTAVEAQGYTTPTPIQAMAIPALLEGRDLLGLAQTGTGKTAAFALPLIQRLSENPVWVPDRATRVLVVAPTRELAIQIDESFNVYGKQTKLRRACIFGGVGSLPQERALKHGVDVLTATPGRLLDLIDRKHLSLANVEAVVFDEADRMFDMGFINDIKKIVKLIPAKRQTLLFSATMPAAIVEFANSLLVDPVRAEVPSTQPTADRVEQRLLFVSRENKRHLLAAIMKEDGFSRVIVFTRTKHGANRLCKQLGPEGIQAEAIHANKSQGQRQRTMKAFREGKIQMLVATDLAARGIDVDDIELVVNFDLPNEPETYVHRIGRTARAGNEGLAISFCDIEERTLLRDIERFVGFRLPVETGHPYALDTEALPLDNNRGGKGAKKGKQGPVKADSSSRARQNGSSGKGPFGRSARTESAGSPASPARSANSDAGRNAATEASRNRRRPYKGDAAFKQGDNGHREESTGGRPSRPAARAPQDQSQQGRAQGGHTAGRRPQENGKRPERAQYGERKQNSRGSGKTNRQRPGRSEDSQANIRLTARRGLEVEEFGVAALFAGRAPLSREAGPSRYDEKQPLTNETPTPNRSGGNGGNGKRRQR